MFVDDYVRSRMRRAGERLAQAGITSPEAVQGLSNLDLERIAHCGGRNLGLIRHAVKVGHPEVVLLLFPSLQTIPQKERALFSTVAVKKGQPLDEALERNPVVAGLVEYLERELPKIGYGIARRTTAVSVVRQGISLAWSQPTRAGLIFRSDRGKWTLPVRSPGDLAALLNRVQQTWDSIDPSEMPTLLKRAQGIERRAQESVPVVRISTEPDVATRPVAAVARPAPTAVLTEVIAPTPSTPRSTSDITAASKMVVEADEKYTTALGRVEEIQRELETAKLGLLSAEREKSEAIRLLTDTVRT